MRKSKWIILGTIVACIVIVIVIIASKSPKTEDISTTTKVEESEKEIIETSLEKQVSQETTEKFEEELTTNGVESHTTEETTLQETETTTQIITHIQEAQTTTKKEEQTTQAKYSSDMGNREEYVKPSMSELEWLKQQYGNTIEVGEKYTYYEKYNAYLNVQYDRTLHIMTSETTSKLVDIYTISQADTIKLANYLGYSTGYKDYKNLPFYEGWGDYYYSDFTKVVFEPIEENNLNYLQSIIVEQSMFTGNNWEYVTIHGLPISLSYGEYLYMPVIFPGDNKPILEKCYFSIEEYYQFLNDYTWTIKEEKYMKDFLNGTFEVIDKYIIVQ